MKKRFLQFLSLLLVCITCLGITACGDANTQLPPSPAPPTSSQTPPQTHATSPTEPQTEAIPEATNADGYIMIAGKSIGYKAGEYFSKNRQNGCKTSAFPSGTCHRNKICDAGTPPCLCIHNTKDVDPSYPDVPLHATQCLGFAHFCQWVVYGDFAIDATDGASKGYSVLAKNVSSDQCTAENVKALFATVPAGTHIRFGGHSIVVISVDEIGMTYVDANFSIYPNNPCIIQLWTKDWAGVSELFKSKGGIECAYAKTQSVKRVYDGSDFIEYVYDEDGNLREEHHCEYHGYRNESYWYDADGRIVDRKDYDMFDVTGLYEYDDNGLLKIHKEVYSSGEIGIQTRYTYDEHGNVIKEEDKAGVLKFSEKYTYSYEYDNQGRVINKKRYLHGSIKYEYVFTYDEQGRIIQKENKTHNDITTYEYDQNGNLICETQIDSPTKTWRYTYTYNENNDMLTYTVQNSDKPPKLKVEKSYDSKGRVIKHTEYDDGAIYDTITTTYEYDALSNVSKMVITRYTENAIKDQRVCHYTYDNTGRLVKWNNEESQYFHYSEIDFFPYYIGSDDTNS